MKNFSQKKLRALSAALCIMFTMSTASIAFADAAITSSAAITGSSDVSTGNALQDRLSAVEKAVYGMPQTGAIIDRINKLERDYYGTVKSSNLLDRINNVYNKIFNNDYSPSTIAQMNGIEWSLMHQVSMQPLSQRLSELETTLYGKPKEGTFYSRMLSLGSVAFGNSSQAIPLSHTLVPANTLIKVKLVTPLNSETMKTGDAVKYQVAEDVVYNGVLVFAAGGFGEGNVTEVKPARNMGRDGKIVVNFENTQAFDGTMTETLLGEKAKKEMESEAMAAGASIAGMAILGPIGIIGGVFIKGKKVDLPAGTELFIQTKSDVTLYGVQANTSNSGLSSTGQTVDQTDSSMENVLNERGSEHGAPAISSNTATLNHYSDNAHKEDLKNSL